MGRLWAAAVAGAAEGGGCEGGRMVGLQKIGVAAGVVGDGVLYTVDVLIEQPGEDDEEAVGRMRRGERTERTERRKRKDDVKKREEWGHVAVEKGGVSLHRRVAEG